MNQTQATTDTTDYGKEYREELGFVRLFPPWLNQGSKGLAVLALQILLYALGFGDRFTPGYYDSVMVGQVKRLQRELGLTGEDVDGNCGRTTRRLLYQQRNVDLDTIPGDCYFSHCYQGPDEWVAPDGQTRTWDIAA